MKIYSIRVLIFAFALLAACSQGQVQSTSKLNLVSVNPDSVLIFRSTYPEWKYKEIGTVIVKNVYDISVIYDKMRVEAGIQGADAIVDFAIESKEEMIPVNSTSCVGDICTTTTKFQSQFVHKATGALAIKAEN